ncbi:hypothetical protein FDI21_gp043 [Pseudomonas phage Noxifer]|uniref:SH3 fold domain-containing protein n=1 Tax=Pseudomonas phage Noxifer TaxID=2006684 RepID=A0A1Y0SX86_9CAUD|nr:hypothetical protein FDI21_gp043 [Pseudomonas phage Noxifer]ARV77214.1 hypothetical protein NOXIFER_43 [Pseudomonas phage Noxifer]
MSTAITEIQIGQRFSFEVYPSAILGNNFKDVTLEGFISPSMAQAFGEDIYSKHSNCYRTLPTTVPNDPLKYNWMRVKHQNGQFSILGVPYVRPDSVQVSTQGVLNLRFDGVNQTDQTRILEALSANGYKPTVNLLTQQ